MSCLENLHINSRHVSDFYCPQRSCIDTAIDDTLACHFFHIFSKVMLKKFLLCLWGTDVGLNMPFILTGDHPRKCHDSD